MGPKGGRPTAAPADGSKKTPYSLNERLFAARRNGVVPEESYAILAVGNEVHAPPDHKRGGPVHVANPMESVLICANLSSVVRGTGGTNIVRIRAIGDHRTP